MVFQSYLFVFLFFPVCLAGYYLLPPGKEGRNAKLWLIGCSLWFYGAFQIRYLPLLLLSILFNYAVYKGLCAGLRGRRGLLAAGIAGNLLFLGYFKYLKFIIDTVNEIFHSRFPAADVLLPLGISFFTFQQIAFLIDAYRGENDGCGPLDYLLFVSFFPYISSGPIVLHGELLPGFGKIVVRRPDGEKLMRGLTLFTLGLAKKVILADTFGRAVDYGYGNVAALSRPEAVIAVVSYSLQLYFDFSGYCDMGRGIARMLGLELPVNFRSPYKAANIEEFWKRWHITLTRFFTRYVYIPLGGNREGKFKMYRNLLLIFLFSGLWHGAGWTFLFWGLLHGILYMATRAYHNRRRAAVAGSAAEAGGMAGPGGAAAGGRRSAGRAQRLIRRGLCTAGTFAYVTAAWIFFRAQSVSQALSMFRVLLRPSSSGIAKGFAECFKLDEFWYVLKLFHADTWKYGQNILMIAMLAFGLAVVLFGRNASDIADKMKPRAVNALLIAGLFLWCVMSFSGVASFLYVNF